MWREPPAAPALVGIQTVYILKTVSNCLLPLKNGEGAMTGLKL